LLKKVQQSSRFFQSHNILKYKKDKHMSQLCDQSIPSARIRYDSDSVCNDCDHLSLDLRNNSKSITVIFALLSQNFFNVRHLCERTDFS